MATVGLPISDPEILEPFEGPDPTYSVKIACWNAQRIGLGSDEEKWDIAEDLQRVQDIKAVILLEGVWSSKPKPKKGAPKQEVPYGFSPVEPIVGSTHDRKLRTAVWHNEKKWDWREIDTIGLAKVCGVQLQENIDTEAPDDDVEEEDDDDSSGLDDDDSEGVDGDEEGSEAADDEEGLEAADGWPPSPFAVATYKVAAAKIRRPTVAVANIGGKLWGLAALHAPAGGENNKVNLAVLQATVWFLTTYFKDKGYNWVLFGDLNRNPKNIKTDLDGVVAVTDGEQKTHSNKHKKGEEPKKPKKPKEPRSSRLKGSEKYLKKQEEQYKAEEKRWEARCVRWKKRKLKFSVLDYALCHEDMKDLVKVEVLKKDEWPEEEAHVDEWVSDHRPILVTITPPDTDAMEDVVDAPPRSIRKRGSTTPLANPQQKKGPGS